ncbi:32524_t:CDS:1, partial [Gigaspora margarita]
YQDLYFTIKYYNPIKDNLHNDEIKKYKDDNHVIVCKSLDEDRCDYIEKFEEETELHLKYYNCEGEDIISQIIEYFSYQYAISKRMNVNETESFAEYMIKNVKNITTFDYYCQKYVGM